MDLQPTYHLEAASSSSTTPSQLPQSDLLQVSNTSTSTPAFEQKPIRSSARVKAAKQKEKERDIPKDKDSDSADQSAFPSGNPRSSKATTSKNKRSRESSAGKGKLKEPTDDSTRAIKRTRRATFPSASSSSLTINEPIQDRKGKKRAAPEADSEEEPSTATFSSSAKRTRTSAYSLRSRVETSTSSSAPMPKKTKTPTKGKVAAKARGGPSSSASRLNDDDIDMLDAGMMRCDNPARDDDKDNYGNRDEDVDIHDNEAAHGDGEGDNRGDDDEMSPTGGVRSFAGLDESAAMAIFGDYRQFGSYMVSLSGRLKTMLNNIKSTASPATRLVTLQELSELLSISTEDTLAGSFQVEDFVGELVKILGGRGVNEDDDDRDDGDEQDDPAVSSTLAMGTGISYQGDENLEAQVLACRCLANLMEALPGVAHTVVYHGAIPVLCSKLIEISYIDLAEQTLSTLEKISEEFPSSIVRENGLAALLSYLDFFSIAVQRTALQAAANCCRNISSDHYSMIRGVWSIIRDCLGYSDQRLVEFACLCVIRVIDSYHRASTENLENLLDASAIRAINALLLPSGGSQMIAANTYTLLLRALATATRASPKITVTLLQADVVDTLYQILTGVLPSATTERNSAEDVTHVTVMENLAHRPKDQVEEALSLVSELMPPLPKDGVFDHKGYTDKALARMVKAKAKAEHAASRQVASLSSQPMTPPDLLQLVNMGHNEGNHESDTPVHDADEPSHAASATDPVSDRTELLRSKPEAVGRFMRLMVPVLIDVYAASVITPIRIKTLTGLLKAVGFLEGDELKAALNTVPVASFASSILSSKDHPSLVIGALQLVDLLLQKVPTEYRPALRREGVQEDAPDMSPTPPPPPMAVHLSSIPGYRKFHSLSLEPEDAITLRARVIRFKYTLSHEDSDGDSSDEFRRLVAKLSAPDATEQVIIAALKDFAEHLTSNGSISSFELLQSGAVEGLLRFATDSGSVSVKRRRELLFEAFTKPPKGGAQGQSPFSVLVKKLQESLTRMENFEVISIAQGSDDSKRSSPSLLARQLRLRLVTDDDSDIPRSLQNMVGQPSRATEPSSAPLASSDISTPAIEVRRRRSQRLSAKNAPFAAMEPPVDTIPSTPVVPRPGSSRREETLIHDGGYSAQLTDDEVDAEVFEDDDVDPAGDKTITLSIAEDGGRVEAQTPDGTRIATPNSARDVSTASGRAGHLSKSSYAAALKAKPIDWHLEFSMDDHVLPLDLTIYGAIHQHEMRKKSGSQPSSSMWQGMYTVKFRKVNGPPPGSEVRGEALAKIRSPSPTLSSLPDEAAHAKILRLLRVLHKLNAAELERPARPYECRALPDSAFINNKLTAKLTRQLEEPMIVASSCLPDWAIDLPQNFPFLFPFTTRYNYLQSTSFGYARLILKWQSQQGRSQDSSRRDDGIGFLGRLQRQKVRISRKHILESAVKVFELYGSSSSILEVEYFEEVGTGLGPTLEFYSLVSKEFARKDLKIWRDADPNSSGAHVHHPTGLYPAPLSPDDIANDGGQKRTHILRVIGQYVAKAMLDSRIIDLSFNKIFIKLVLGEEVPFTIDSLRLVDNDLANSLAKLQGYASMKGQNEKLFWKVALMDIVNVEDLALDFTLPGYDMELRPGGRDIPVTSENVEQYIHDVLDAIIGSGVQSQAKAFREGFSKVFPISDLQAFSADELVMLFGNSDEDWGVETLSEAIKADHGFHGESRSIRELIELMSEFDPSTRRDYLQFITGSPKLPIGGSLQIPPDAYLPSVMTCVNYLKLPEYSSKKIMRDRLLTAIKEGVGSFPLFHGRGGISAVLLLSDFGQT
ncbi:ubiquitin-protein ligase [Pisolithus croceorrhizus]|nr:ubiquitin-protein ligase [Pisolithus croceorrhizus]